MDVELNYLGIVLAAIASLGVGALWYSKALFGKQWFKLTGLTEKQAQEGAGKDIAVAFVLALITAYVLAHVAYISQAFFDVSYLSSSLSTAFWLWLGISATTIGIHYTFEKRPKQLTMLGVSNQFVTYLLMGLIIGLVGI